MRLAIATLAVGLVAALGPAGAAVSPDPIVGVWRYGGGTVVVTGDGSRFTGVVREPVTFAECPHGRGELMWTIVKTKTGYAGRHRSFGPRVGCGWRVWLSANWAVAGDRLTVWVARFEGRWARNCGNVTVCFALRRAGAAPAAGEAPVSSVAVRVDGKPFAARGAPASYESSVLEGSVRLRPPGGSFVLFHVHSEGDGELLQLAVERATAARFEVVVTSSSGPPCRSGSRGVITAVDGKHDAVTLSLCGRVLRFRSGEGATVSVRTA